MRKLSCTYLYTDGTLIEHFDEFRKNAKIGETVDVTLGYCTLNLAAHNETETDGYKSKRKVNGRIVFHSWKGDGVIALAKGGTINATLPALAEGSENSRSRGIKVQHVELRTKAGLRFHWTDCEIVRSQFTLQETSVEHAGKILAPGCRWGYAATVYAVRDMRKLSEVAHA
jgi:hypothetical protein